MRVIDCEQGSGAWLAARVGKITASRVADVLAYTKKGDEAQKRADYRIELVSERLSGQAVEKYVTFAMKEGTRLEPEARTEYELLKDVMLDRIGFAMHPAMEFSGASPDGLVGKDGGVEIKCPTRTTHIEYLLAGIVPPEYEPQMVWNMVCCERMWWDFVSFCPDFPAPLNLFTVRLLRDELRIDVIDAEVRKMHAEVEASISALKGAVELRDIAARAVAA
jgi:putative phage-type endonuclease